MTSFRIGTSQRTEFVDITGQVMEAVRESGISDGIVTVFVPHTTAGVTINENADPSVVRDIISTLNRLVPRDSGYSHTEGNADSHIKASLMGSSVQVLLEGESWLSARGRGSTSASSTGRDREMSGSK